MTKSVIGWTRHLKDRPRADPPGDVLADLAAARAEENAARRANDGPREFRAAVAYSDRFMRWLYEEINERGINLNVMQNYANQWIGRMNGIQGFFSAQIEDVARGIRRTLPSYSWPDCASKRRISNSNTSMDLITRICNR